MSTVIRASTLGFCMGVRRAIRLVDALAIGRVGQICTLGEIVHNQDVTRRLAARGVTVVEEVDKIASGSVVIRAHGVEKGVKEHLEKHAFTIVDGTCPKVACSQRIVETYSRTGYDIAIVGDARHPEIKSVISYSTGDPRDVLILTSRKEALLTRLSRKTVLLAQTTIEDTLFDQIFQGLQESNPQQEITAERTICSSTRSRQEAIRALSYQVEAIVIVGSRTSANTRELVSTAEKSGKPSWLVEGADTLPETIFSFKIVGIGAGASTPEETIAMVEKTLQEGKSEAIK